MASRSALVIILLASSQELFWLAWCGKVRYTNIGETRQAGREWSAGWGHFSFGLMGYWASARPLKVGHGSGALDLLHAHVRRQLPLDSMLCSATEVPRGRTKMGLDEEVGGPPYQQ